MCREASFGSESRRARWRRRPNCAARLNGSRRSLPDLLALCRLPRVRDRAHLIRDRRGPWGSTQVGFALGIVGCEARSYRERLPLILIHERRCRVGMPSKNESHVIASADLERFASALFAAAGVAPAMADEWAKSLVWANLRGVDSHGVLRIPGYIERLKTGAINPTPQMRVEKRAGAVAVLEADRAPGAVAMATAMAEAIARAREAHIGWCAARNITHAGAVGYFALQAASAGMAS